jgi:hypothetical protein
MIPMRLFLFAALLGAFGQAAEINVLTPAEQKAGWVLLFDGKTMRGWQDPAQKNQPGDAWAIMDGCLKTVLNPRIGEDLLTAESFRNFDLKFDWRVAPGGNTGLKYLVQRAVFMDSTKAQKGPGGFEAMLGREMANPLSDRAKLAPGARADVYTVAFECQLIDDERHPDARRDATHYTGALYSFLAPTSRPLKPAGEWNTGRVVLRGKHVEHWINDVKVLDGSIDSEAVRVGAAQRWKDAPEVLKMLTEPRMEAPICLQFHGDEVWFRNIKVLRLP